MSKIILILAMLLTSSVFVFAQSNFTDDTFVITTYYPAPYGVYRNMRLQPSDDPTGREGVVEGVMYYDRDLHMMRYLNDTAWVNVTAGGGGGEGYWIKNSDNIYNNNSGNVGIGTNNPTEKLEVKGGGIKITSNDVWYSRPACSASTRGLLWNLRPNLEPAAATIWQAKLYASPGQFNHTYLLEASTDGVHFYTGGPNYGAHGPVMEVTRPAPAPYRYWRIIAQFVYGPSTGCWTEFQLIMPDGKPFPITTNMLTNSGMSNWNANNAVDGDLSNCAWNVTSVNSYIMVDTALAPVDTADSLYICVHQDTGYSWKKISVQ